jgi:circadian clock protein KaiC
MANTTDTAGAGNSSPGGGQTKTATGIAGLDDILRGGLTPNRMYLVEGDPGAGKTTLATQFLLEGVRLGEPVLYVTLSETKEELTASAATHGWDLSAVPICELVPSEQKLSPDAQLTMFHPSEVELGETTAAMLEQIERHKPRRVVLDSLSELRLVAQNSLRYRRQVLALKQFFAGRQCTAMLLDDRSAGHAEDAHLHSIAHGVISLDVLATSFGAERRQLRVRKLRGVAYRGGLHDFAIRTGGLHVFPRLVAAEHHAAFGDGDLTSGNAGLDALLGGGLPAGTSTLLLGPAGTGKSTIATLFATAAAARGERSALFAFDENLGTLRSRSRKLGIPIEAPMADGLVSVRQVDPAELSPGEFAATVRDAVDGADDPHQRPARLIVIDSLNGYLNSMAEEKMLAAQLHELLAYLGQKGVTTLLSVTQSGMIGSNTRSPIDTTYLADNVILFRYFEARGNVRRAVSVVKKRSGPHESSIREMRVSAGGVEIGEPLSDFHGILSGIPTYSGAAGGPLPRGGHGG